MRDCVCIPVRSQVFQAFYDLEQRLQWDTLLTRESRVVEQIDTMTDVVYFQVRPALRGLVKARDYVDVRRYVPQKDGGALLFWRGVARYPGVAQSAGVRGRNFTCGILFSPATRPDSSSGGHTPCCLMTMIAQTQANGWVPQSVIDRATRQALMDFPVQLRRFLAVKHSVQKR
jgi:hypothetical protein